MIKQLEKKQVEGKNVLMAMVVFALFQTAMILWIIPIGGQYYSEIPLEGRMFYSTEDMTHFFYTLGAHGRNCYVPSNLLDSLFAVCYGYCFFYYPAVLGEETSLKDWAFGLPIPPGCGIV